MIRVVLPAHLRNLAKTSREISLEVREPVTLAAVVSALEARYPMLAGTIRRQDTGQRRAMIRFFAEGRDLSHQPMGADLPESVAAGHEPLLIVGAIAGG
ncbi:MAG: MoaD/ThiS family protein [Anaerolineales bacterium]